MTQLSLPDQFRSLFGHGDHLYGVLLADLADDLEAGGATARICRDVSPDAVRSDAIHLRLLAGVFRIVLRGDAPQLRPFYPCLGGEAASEDCWPLLQPVLAAHEAELRDAVHLPPQTNEVGRAACLAVGLALACAQSGVRRVRLLEPGASAGLNLNVGHYRVTGPGWALGPPHSPVSLESGCPGIPGAGFDVVERRGCDLSPVDVSTPAGRDHLTSFVWPYDLLRHERLAAALRIAATHPVTVDRAPASQWVAQQLARPVPPDVLTVVWESITRQYWSPAEAAAVDDVIDSEKKRIPLAHLSMEGIPPVQVTDGYDVATHGPTLRLDGVPVARSHHHGPPIVPLV